MLKRFRALFTKPLPETTHNPPPANDPGQQAPDECGAKASSESADPTVAAAEGRSIDPYVTRQAIDAAKGATAPPYPLLSVAVPAVTPQMILDSQSKLVDEIQRTSALAHADFNALIVPMLLNYAAFVHLLPASENHHHAGQGGLFRHGLEVAFYATLKCEGAVFAVDHTPSERKNLEPRWRIAALIGGLLHDLGKPLIDVGAMDASGNLMWSPYTQTLFEWTQDNKLDHYFIQWRPGARYKRHESFTPVAMGRIVPAQTMQWLSDHKGHEAIDAMMLALGGSTDPRNPLNAMLKAADSASVARDIADSRTRLASSGMGGVRNLAAQIMRAIFDLVAGGQWKLNQPGDVIWVTEEGIFAVVPEMAKQIIEVLREKGEHALPNDTATVIELLGDNGYLVPCVQPNGQTFNTWRVRLKTTYQGDDIEVPIHAVRFSRNDMFEESLVPPKLAGVVFMDVNGKPITAAAATPKPSGASKPKATPKPAPTPAGSVESAERSSAPASPEPKMSPRQQELLPPDLVEAERDPLLPGDDDEPSPSEEPEGGDDGMEGETPNDQLSVAERARKFDMNIRDVEFNDARWANRSDWPPGSVEAAEDWFTSHRPEGEFLLAIAKRVREKSLVAGRDVVFFEGSSHIRYPEALSDLGMNALDLLKLFQEKGWAVRDVNTPSRGTVAISIAGQRKAMTAVRLNAHVSAAFEMILPESAQSSRVVDALPWGPYIDKDAAAHLSNKNVAIESEAPWIRLAFQKFVDHREGALIHAPTPAPTEWTGLIKTFCRMHRIKVSTWLFNHLTMFDNPLLKVHEEDRWATWETAKFDLNPEYRGDLDVVATTQPGEQNQMSEGTQHERHAFHE